MVPGFPGEPHAGVQRAQCRAVRVDKEGLECHTNEFSFYLFGQ